MTEAPDLLVVCTANIARSPMLHVRLQHEADQRLGPSMLRLNSAGTDARYGDGAAEGSRKVAERWGLSLDAHISTPIAYVALAEVPLVLVMTRTHRRVLAWREASSSERSFTVPELVECLRRLRDAGQLPEPPSATQVGPMAPRPHLAEVARLAHAVRPRQRWNPHLDVPDPIGGSQATYDALGARFEIEATAIADALFGPVAGN